MTRIFAPLMLLSTVVIGCARAPSVPGAFREILECKEADASAVDIGAEHDRDASSLGPLSDLAARARDFFAAKDWERATPVLQRVIRGEGQDTPGTIELANYELGVAYFHMKRADLTFEQMKPIALDRGHVRHREALAWLGNAALVGPRDAQGNLPIDYVYAYTPDELALFDQPGDQALFKLLVYLKGRAAYRRGRYDEVFDTMDRVVRWPEYKSLAEGCTKLARTGLRQSLPGPAAPPP